MSNNSQTPQYFPEMRIPNKRLWSGVVSTPSNVDALFSVLLECFSLTRRKDRGEKNIQVVLVHDLDIQFIMLNQISHEQSRSYQSKKTIHILMTSYCSMLFSICLVCAYNLHVYTYIIYMYICVCIRYIYMCVHKHKDK